MDKEKLVKKINGIYQECRKPNWDNQNALAISEDTYKHGLRFLNKLEKHNISTDNLTISPLTDDNLSFVWAYPDSTTFNIDFDRSTDCLLWCCFKDDKHFWEGSCPHFEDIVKNLQLFINYHEKKQS